MTTISTISQGTTSQASQTSANTTISSDSTSSEQQSDKEVRRLALSERAQKIQKLNEEFFQGGPRSVQITPEFIQRLEEYGFLKTSEADSFLSQLQSTPTSTEGTLGELSDFIDGYLANSENQNESLAEILNKAKSIINNLDGSNPSSLALDIKTTSAELTQFLNSEEGKQLSESDKSQFEQLNMALKIADKLEPENLSSAKVNQYLQVMGQG